MYKVVTEGDTAILYRVAKSGRESECMRVINTDNGRLLIIDKSKKDSYIFREQNISLVKMGTQYVAKITAPLKVFIKPHYIDYHNVMITESNNRYSLANAKYRQSIGVTPMHIDDQVILNNMLEYIGQL